MTAPATRAEGPFVLAEREGDIVWLTLNRPERLNAVHLAMRDELWMHLGLLRDDPTVRVAVVRGAGDRAFSAGADITEFGTAPSYIEARQARTSRDLWGLMSSLSLPLVAAVQGYAYGAGLELSLYCDIRVAAEDAQFALPEVTLGYIPSAGGSQTIGRHIPLGEALRLATTGQPVDARRAFELGMVHEVVPRDGPRHSGPALGRAARRAACGRDPSDETCDHRGTRSPTRAGTGTGTAAGCRGPGCGSDGRSNRRDGSAMSGDSMANGWRGGLGRVGQAFGGIGDRLGRWDSRGRLTIAGLALVLVVGVAGSLWGAFIADPDVRLQQLDAGPVGEFAIGEVKPFPEQNVYMVGIEDGRIRALDGIIKDSGCAVEWLPADTRTQSVNPERQPGAFLDPCSGAVWTTVGNAFSGTSDPMRTFQIDYETNDAGVQHVWVEVIGDRSGQP